MKPHLVVLPTSGRKEKISSYDVILSPGVLSSFLLHVTFVPWRPEYKLIPPEFIFLPTIICDNYCADYVCSNNLYDSDKIIFSMMPYSMCFVSKYISTTERMMIGHGELIHGCGLQAVGMLELPLHGEQHLLEIDNGMELPRTIDHGEMSVAVESAQLEIVAALQAMGSLQDNQGEKRSDKSLQKEGGQCNRTHYSYRRKSVGTNDWMGRE